MAEASPKRAEWRDGENTSTLVVPFLTKTLSIVIYGHGEGPWIVVGYNPPPILSDTHYPTREAAKAAAVRLLREALRAAIDALDIQPSGGGTWRERIRRADG